MGVAGGWMGRGVVTVARLSSGVGVGYRQGSECVHAIVDANGKW